MVSEAETVPWIQELTGYCLPVTTNVINNEAKKNYLELNLVPCFACPTCIENTIELNSDKDVFVFCRVNPEKIAQT